MPMNLITGIAAVLIGGVYTWMSILLPHSPFGDPIRHIVFPIIIGVGMLILGFSLTILELIQLHKSGKKLKITLPKTLTRYGKEMMFAILASVVYALIFETAGYVLSTILYLGSILFLINGKKGTLVNIIVAVTFSVGVYVLFGYVLGIQLPRLPFLDI
jgi:putative tricarboxylic transport membrane protein